MEVPGDREGERREQEGRSGDGGKGIQRRQRKGRGGRGVVERRKKLTLSGHSAGRRGGKGRGEEGRARGEEERVGGPAKMAAEVEDSSEVVLARYLQEDTDVLLEERSMAAVAAACMEAMDRMESWKEGSLSLALRMMMRLSTLNHSDTFFLQNDMVSSPCSCSCSSSCSCSCSCSRQLLLHAPPVFHAPAPVFLVGFLHGASSENVSNSSDT
eukprot:746976-Hanusia_phi.AAC.1